MRKITSYLLLGILMAAVVGIVGAASGGSIAFSGDANQPMYEISGVTNLVVDDTDCDFVTMLMADATGIITDSDTFCINTGTGEGSEYTDWASYSGAPNVPVKGPITYALFDTDLASACYSDENSIACADELLSGAYACIAEDYFQPASLPAGTPNSICGGGVTAAGCTLNVPSGSVVGDMPLGAQAYYSPDNAAPGVVLNPGTYIVVGQDSTETYYKIVLACRFLWVRKDTMQPSYQPPQNGAPLPTRIVS